MILISSFSIDTQKMSAELGKWSGRLPFPLGPILQNGLVTSAVGEDFVEKLNCVLRMDNSPKTSVIIILLRFGDFFRVNMDEEGAKEYFSDTLERMQILFNVYSKSHCLVAVCPEIPDADEIKFRFRENCLISLKKCLISAKEKDGCLNVHAIEEDFSFTGKEVQKFYYSCCNDKPSGQFYSELNYKLARELFQTNSLPIKLVITDLDGTVGEGNIGDVDGISNFKFTPFYLKYQKQLVKLSNLGYPIAIVSKNPKEVIEEFFRQRENEMTLKRKHVAIIIGNYKEKAENIVELSKKLGGIDPGSFIYIDNSKMEIEKMREAWPQILSILFNSKIVCVLKKLWVIRYDKKPTKEDEMRTRNYSLNDQRDEVRSKCQTYGEFCKRIQLQTYFQEIDASSLERVQDLISKANQFNSHAPLVSKDIFAKNYNRDNYKVYTIYIEDNVGSNGIVGVIGGRVNGKTFEISILVMSCSVVSPSRAIEYIFLSEVAKKVGEYSCETISVEFTVTDKNTPLMSAYFNHLNLEVKNVNGDTFTYESPIEKIQYFCSQFLENPITSCDGAKIAPDSKKNPYNDEVLIIAYEDEVSVQRWHPLLGLGLLFRKNIQLRGRVARAASPMSDSEIIISSRNKDESKESLPIRPITPFHYS